MRVTGLDGLQKQLRQLECAIGDLNEPVNLPAYDYSDAVAVQGAITTVDTQIDERAAKYVGNQTVQELAQQLKAQYRERILADVAAQRISGSKEVMNNDHGVKDELRQLENAVQDMLQIDYQSAQSLFSRLNHVLRNGQLAAITSTLSAPIDLDSWLKDCHSTGGSFIGSASLKWPLSPEERTGLIAKIIERIASDEINLNTFSFTFFYSGTSINPNLRKLVAQMIVPFLRDYRDHTIKTFGLDMDDKKPAHQHVGHQVNLYNSQVVSLQTGDHAVANVSISCAVPESAALIEALEGVARELAKIHEIPGHDKLEILELVEDSKGEIRKEKPNKSKVKSYLSGIAGAIGTLSNMKSAYELLTVAAAAAGFTLPSM